MYDPANYLKKKGIKPNIFTRTLWRIAWAIVIVAAKTTAFIRGKTPVEVVAEWNERMKRRLAKKT